MKTKAMYKNCSELPIFNFFEILRKQDLSLLVRPGFDSNKINTEELSALLMDILKEYNSLTNNIKLINEYKAKIDIDYMEARYNFTKKIISMYLKYNDIDILLTIKEFGWHINENKHIDPQLSRINKNLIGLKNKIKIRKSNFLQKYGKEALKNNKQTDIEEQAIYLETGIPLSYKIDIHKDSIKRFIYLGQVLDKKNKQLLKNNGKV